MTQRPIVQRLKKKPPIDPKPCPTCYWPMKAVGENWECAKHGAPAKT